MPENRIRQLREERDLTQAELGHALGVDKSTVCRWEVGQTKPNGDRETVSIPDQRKAQIAAYFGVSVPFLMNWDSGAVERVA